MEKHKKYSTLLELSKEWGVKKPTLIYYTQLGLMVPDMVAGTTALFENAAVNKQWLKIQKLRKTNTLSQIRTMFAAEYANRKK